MIFLSDKQVAERYNVNRASVWRWVKNGFFPEPLKLTPGCTRWALAELEKWEAERMSTRKADAG